MNTAFCFDPKFLEHDTGLGHPERADRLNATIVHLRRQPWFQQLLPVRAIACDLEWIHQIHDPMLGQRAESACRTGLPYLDTP
ncbi:MAG: hypothetical protein VYB37_07640, partial [Pseudomonadota bacterium]|nr:hypothetical protein [Pseudomonadota bacterium]